MALSWLTIYVLRCGQRTTPPRYLPPEVLSSREKTARVRGGREGAVGRVEQRLGGTTTKRKGGTTTKRHCSCWPTWAVQHQKFGKNDSKNSTNCKMSLRKNLKIEFPIETRYIKKVFLNLNKTEIRPKSKNDLLLL